MSSTAVTIESYGIDDDDLANEWVTSKDGKMVLKLVIKHGTCLQVSGIITNTDPKSGHCDIKITDIRVVKPN